MKLDDGGNHQWHKTVGGKGQDLLASLTLTRDNGIVAAGSSTSPISGDKSSAPRQRNADGLVYSEMDYWIIKLL
ncbi:hypothetical protein [Larkinella arboricola]|nr:hypothetical protein [Larkinella arboricola]